MSVTSIFDDRLSRNKIAAAELSAAQGYAPSRHDSFRSFVEALHGTDERVPLVLASPPSTWRQVISSLRDSNRQVIAYHTDCFDADGAAEVREAFERLPGRIFLIGLDPGWPKLTLSRYFEYAWSRGAVQSCTQIEHDGWSRARLSSVVFDCLNCAVGEIPDKCTIHHFRKQRSSEFPVVCHYRSVGRNVELETEMIIDGDLSKDGQMMESLEAFREFAVGSDEERLRANKRARILFDRSVSLSG
jgi:hypothetical protein